MRSSSDRQGPGAKGDPLSEKSAVDYLPVLLGLGALYAFFFNVLKEKAFFHPVMSLTRADELGQSRSEMHKECLDLETACRWALPLAALPLVIALLFAPEVVEIARGLDFRRSYSLSKSVFVFVWSVWLVWGVFLSVWFSRMLQRRKTARWRDEDAA